MTDGLHRVGGVVVLSGDALRAAMQCVVITIRNRALSGLPNGTYEQLAQELGAAMAEGGQSDVRTTAVREIDVMQRPTVPIGEAATRLGLSHRQVRRLAPKLGGQIIGGRWLVDELAVREHIEGATP